MAFLFPQKGEAAKTRERRRYCVSDLQRSSTEPRQEGSWQTSAEVVVLNESRQGGERVLTNRLIESKVVGVVGLLGSKVSRRPSDLISALPCWECHRLRRMELAHSWDSLCTSHIFPPSWQGLWAHSAFHRGGGRDIWVQATARGGTWNEKEERTKMNDGKRLLEKRVRQIALQEMDEMLFGMSLFWEGCGI